MDFYINDDTAWLRKAVRWVVNIVVAIACGWFLVYGFGTIGTGKEGRTDTKVTGSKGKGR